MITIRDLVRTWENMSYDSTIQIDCFKRTKYKDNDYIGSIKMKVKEIIKKSDPYNDLIDQEIIAFRKSVHGIRIAIKEDLSNES